RLAFKHDLATGGAGDGRRAHRPERLRKLQQGAGVAHALGRLGLLEVGEELADVAQLADVGGAPAPGDPTARPEKVGEDRNFVTDGVLEKQRRAALAQDEVT